MSTHLYLRVYIGLLICLVLASCNGGKDGPLPTSAPTQLNETPTPTLAATETNPPKETTTPVQPSLVVLLAPSDTNPTQIEDLTNTLSDLASAEDLQFNIKASLSPEDLLQNIRLVVAMAPDPGIEKLAESAPNTQFLGIGIPGLKSSDNISLIGPAGARPDELGFLAGYLAAAITPEWRVGIINVSDTSVGVTTRDGFLNGAIFFCGLCQPTHPPFVYYPLYLELPSGASQEEWLALTDVLLDKSVKTVFIPPEVSDDALFNSLAQAGINLIGTSTPPLSIRQHWVASIYPDYIPILKEIWPLLLDGNGNISRRMSLSIGDINPELLSPGRLHIVEDMLKDLQSGYIDIGTQQLPTESNETSP